MPYAHVIDRHTDTSIRSYPSAEVGHMKLARRYADKKNDEYGAGRYYAKSHHSTSYESSPDKVAAHKAAFDRYVSDPAT